MTEDDVKRKIWILIELDIMIPEQYKKRIHDLIFGVE